jgi:four helix bundle protein
MFDHQKLEVYQLALRFSEWLTPLLEEVKEGGGSKTTAIRKHLDEASLSIVLNISEGNGKRQMKTRARFFDDARGSTSECAGCLDALVARGVCTPERVGEGNHMLHRIYSMLTKLIQRFDSDQ